MHLVADGPPSAADSDDALCLDAGTGEPPRRQAAEGTHELRRTRYRRVPSHEHAAVASSRLGPSNTELAARAADANAIADLVNSLLGSPRFMMSRARIRCRSALEVSAEGTS